MKSSWFDTLLYIALLTGFLLWCFAVAIVLGFAVGGCCPYGAWPVPLKLDEEFTTEEVVAIARAVDDWDQATGTTTALLSPGAPHGWGLLAWYDLDVHMVHRLHEDEPFVQFRRAQGSKFIGVQAGGSIALAIDLFNGDMDYITHVMRHELGHLYGICDHRPGTLMNGHGNSLDCIDGAVLAEVCAIQDACIDPEPTCS